MRNIEEGIVGSFGQEIDILFTYNGTAYDNENVYRVRVYYDANLFTSLMKCLELRTTENIVEGEIISDVKAIITNTDGDTATIEYGDFIVYSNEKDEDTGLFDLTCYDNMLKTMVKYEYSPTYPITLKQYVKGLATLLGFRFDDTKSFVNDSLVIESTLYSEDDTYRNVLEDVAQATASITYFKGDELVIGYPNITTYTMTESGLKQAKTSSKYGHINSVVLSRGDVEDSVYAQDMESILEEGLCEIKFDSNPFLDSENDNDRLTYARNILSKVITYQFDVFDCETFGTGVLEPLDVFTLQLTDEETEETKEYTCLAVKNDVLFEQSFVETFNYEKPEATQTDYSIATEKEMIRKVYVKVDKQNATITSLVNDVGEATEKIAQVEQTADGITSKVASIEDDVVKQQTTFSIKEDGAYISNNNPNSYSKFADKGMEIYSERTKIAEATAETFKAPSFTTNNWTMREEENGKVLNFFRGEL